jgi:hypothetical protein
MNDNVMLNMEATLTVNQVKEALREWLIKRNFGMEIKSIYPLYGQRDEFCGMQIAFTCSAAEDIPV